VDAAWRSVRFSRNEPQGPGFDRHVRFNAATVIEDILPAKMTAGEAFGDLPDVVLFP
jgi:hypothetical protein